MKYKLLRATEIFCIFVFLLSMPACQTTITPTSSEDRDITNETPVSPGSVVATDIGGGNSSCPPGWVESLPGVCSNYHNGGTVCPPRFILTVFVIPGSGNIENVACCPAGIRPESVDECEAVTLCGPQAKHPRFVDIGGNIVLLCCPSGKPDLNPEGCLGPGKAPRPRRR